MARPRVFISSTFYDLRHLRSSLEIFVRSIGYDPVLSEKGDITYSADRALDESCYAEAASADIFVLVVGGRYGSLASSTKSKSAEQALEDYESITRREFEAAHSADIPIFILVETGVLAEYQTYVKNKDNDTIKYAHVDSINIFKFIDSIYIKPKNNAVQAFSDGSDIESWLKEQWAGLFREFLRSRTNQNRLTNLQEQVGELKAVNSTLKNYLEEIIRSVNPKNSKNVITRQDNKLKTARIVELLKSNAFFNFLLESHDREIFDDNAIFDIARKPNSADKLIELLCSYFPGQSVQEIKGVNILRIYHEAQDDYNKARRIVGRPPIDFTNSSDSEMSYMARTRGLEIAQKV